MVETVNSLQNQALLNQKNSTDQSVAFTKETTAQAIKNYQDTMTAESEANRVTEFIQKSTVREYDRHQQAMVALEKPPKK